MDEVTELSLSPLTGKPEQKTQMSTVVSAPPLQLESTPSMSRSPLLESDGKFPKSPLKSSLMMSSTTSPMASPMKKVITSMQGYLEEVGRFTRLDNPQDTWLPITESRNGNAFYAAFHTLSSGIGVQALVLPLAFTTLGWIWGVVCLSLFFMWQLYTLWLLIQLHELESGTRHSRYLKLSMSAFGEKLGKLMCLFPIMYLSGGTCVTLIMIGGGTMKLFFQTVCDIDDAVTPLTIMEWYVVFICLAIILAQLPNLNSIAGVSLVGAITAVGYCTIIWVVSVVEGKPEGVSSDSLEEKSDVGRVFSSINALGIIAFAFRGHNLVLEIQGSMPSSGKYPSRVPMWKGVKFAYCIVAMCLFPLAIAGYWAYGNLIPATSNEGMLSALYKYHRQDTSKVLLGIISLFVVINSLSSFQIYAMPVFDNLEFRYTSKFNRPCPRWLRCGIRIFFGCFSFFISVALPFLPSLAGLIGGVALPITMAYPCFMWLQLKKPQKHSLTWYFNWALGISGMVLSILVVTGAIWGIVTMGIDIHFFKPQ